MSNLSNLSEEHRKVAQMRARQRGATVRELAEQCQMSERAVSNLIERLQAKGLRIENVQRGTGRFHLARVSRPARGSRNAA